MQGYMQKMLFERKMKVSYLDEYKFPLTKMAWFKFLSHNSFGFTPELGLNYLRMSSKVDAVRCKVQSAVTMKAVSNLCIF